MHKMQAINPPIIAISKMILFITENGFKQLIMIIPYPPNFNKIAARIMDPAIGASTCAFGNHRCRKNIGVLTKNALIKGIKSSLVWDVIGSTVVLINIVNERCRFDFINSVITKRSGKDAVTVQIIIYILACRRSGWYPHIKIKINVGINAISKKIQNKIMFSRENTRIIEIVNHIIIIVNKSCFLLDLRIWLRLDIIISKEIQIDSTIKVALSWEIEIIFNVKFILVPGEQRILNLSINTNERVIIVLSHLSSNHIIAKIGKISLSIIKIDWEDVVISVPAQGYN